MEVITGPMSCGKTEELMRRLRRAEIAKKKVVLYKPIVDTRSSRDATASRNGLVFPAVAVRSASDLVTDWSARKADVVGIEEAQFLDPKIVAAVQYLISEGARVILAGLNTDFRGEPFGPMPYLMAMADTTTSLSAICMVCGSDGATRTQRLIDGRPAPYDSVIVQVGGDECYEARCRRCHAVPRLSDHFLR